MSLFQQIDLELFATYLGYVVAAVGTVRTLPQIITIIRSGSVQGISLVMFVIEVVAFWAYLAYGIRRPLPLSTFAEFFVLILQTTAVFFLIIHHRFRVASVVGIGAVILYFVQIFAIFSMDFGLLESWWKIIVPASALRGIPQVLSNYKNGHTGQLNLLFVCLSLFGTSSRILTTLILVPENIQMLATFVMATIVNVTSLSQILYYRKATAAFNKKTQKKKAK